MALNGSETVRADILQQFAQAFKPCGFDLKAFCPGYGLAEATLKVAAVRQQDLPVFLPVDADALAQNRVVEARANQQNVRILVGCGRSEIDTQIVIVDPESLLPCQDREVGEIWVSGSSVAQGYWGKPEQTKQTFQATLKGDSYRHFLRTGDLGFIKDGEIFVTGRIKELIIIQGRNLYPQDIELTVEKSHPALRPNCGAAFAVEFKDEEQLVVVHEVERSYRRQLDVNEVIGNIREAVAVEHEVRVHTAVLLKTGAIPKTSSGKIQRQVCRQTFVDTLAAIHFSQIIYSS
jgi:acyl-CoA synthetase (AMP-forming)/AMP-acid ligase II